MGEIEIKDSLNVQDKTFCNLCNKRTVKTHIQLNNQPICNRFLQNSFELEQTFPINFGQCESCSLSQLVSPAPYEERTPKLDWITYVEPEGHLDDLAEKISKLPGLNLDSKIFGIGVNDKPLLNRMAKLGFNNAKVLDLKNDLGLDNPNSGVEAVQAVLTIEKAKTIVEKEGLFDLVVARYIFEHTENLQGLLESLKTVLSPNGYIIIEVPDCTLGLDKKEYVMLWEEHLAYFTPTTIRHLFDLSNLSLEHFGDYEPLVVIGRKVEEKLDTLEISSIEKVNEVMQEAVSKEIASVEKFGNTFSATKDHINTLLKNYKKEKGKIALLGAGHFACGFINYFDLKDLIECVIDDNPHKQGLFMPGSKIPIYNSTALLERGIKLCLLSVNPRIENKVKDNNKIFIDNGGEFCSIFVNSEIALNKSTVMPNKVKKIAEGIFAVMDNIIKINKSYIDFIKSEALKTNLKRARLCFHPNSNEPIHEMLIASSKDGYVRPHKHENKTESFSVIEGEIDVIIFNDNGTIEETIEMGDPRSDKKFYYRSPKNQFHSVIVKTPIAVFHETTNGPFSTGDSIYAEWSPEENDKERISSFLDKIRKQIDLNKKKEKEIGEIKMEESHYIRTTCRLCDSNDMDLRVPITSTPVGGDFVSEAKLGHEQEVFSLDMHQCNSCGHVQLLDVVNPEILWSNYSYFSGGTSIVKHFAEYSQNVITKSNLQEGSFVVDIGSNDGEFLRFFKNKGMKVLGVDAATNIVGYANQSGIETIPAMFNLETSNEIRNKYGPADVVTANNVFAHTDDMKGMALSVQNLLAHDGLFYFEVSYLLDVVDKMLLGTIFHEHLCFHSVKSLVPFLKSVGLELIDVERNSIQGGSLICTVQRIDGKRPVATSVNELIELEESRGVYRPEYLENFSKKLQSIKSEVTTLLEGIKARGESVAAFGAARGGTLLVYNFGLGEYINYIVDDDPKKQNLYSPGYHIPVVPTSTLHERKPDNVLILAWVHSKAIIENNQEYLRNGGKFISFFPELKVTDASSLSNSDILPQTIKTISGDNEQV
jgi:cupin fold WbuC family metalloprotein